MNSLRSLLVGLVCSLSWMAPSSAAAQQVLAEILVPNLPPDFMALNDVTHRAYTIGDGGSAPVLAMVDVAAQTVVMTVELPDFHVTALAVDTGANRVFLTGDDQFGVNTLVAMDGSTLEPIYAVETPQVFALEVNPVTHRIYAFVGTNPRIAIYDGETGDWVAGATPSISLPIIAVDSIRNIVYFAGHSRFGGEFIHRLDGETNEMLEPFEYPADHTVSFFAINQPVNRLTSVVSDGNGDTLVMTMDGVTGAVLSSPIIGLDPLGLSVNPVTSRAYVVGYQRDAESTPQWITTVDESSGAIISTFPILMEPTAMAVDASLNQLVAAGYATTQFSGAVFVVELSEDQQDTEAPEINVPDGIDAEAMWATGAAVTFEVSAVDAVDGPVAAACSPESGSTFPMGVTIVHCTAADGTGNSATRSFAVTVRDTTAPVIVSLVPSRATLWPPNHQMEPVTIAATATDVISTPTCRIGDVFSNQPSNNPADVDWIVSLPLSLQLRSERDNSNDRVYTIRVDCQDAAGNTTRELTTVTVALP